MHSFQASLFSPDPRALFAEVTRSQLVATGLPRSLRVDDHSREVTKDWAERWPRECVRDVFAAWDDDYGNFASFSTAGIVKAAATAVPIDSARIVAWLHGLPFEVASVGPIHEQWYSRPDFPVTGFGDLHFPLGWACAFRGAGHGRLVSRRWLEAGNWRVVPSAGDISFVEFHPVELDAERAFAVAKPAHVRMGISEQGGFIQSDYVFTHPPEGLYLPREKRLKVLVHGRAVSPLEMLDACAARRYQAIESARPLETIAYVFADEHAARAHLDELWLHELECWTFSAGREVRLDTAGRPPP